MIQTVQHVRVTPAPALPVTLAEAKLHCRIPGSAEDTLVTALITAATDWMTEYLERSLVREVWELSLWTWPWDAVIELPRPPVLDIESIKYLDINRVEQTLAPSLYRLVTVDKFQAFIEPTHNAVWPTTQYESGAVKVRYRAGYAPTQASPPDYAANVPAALKQGILMHVAELYENRETSLVNSTLVQNPAWLNLVQPYRNLQAL